MTCKRKYKKKKITKKEIKKKKGKKRTTLLLIFALLLLPVVVANTYQINTTIDIRHPIRVDGSPAPNAICNITVLNPINNIIVDYREMENKSSSHNYSVNYSLIDQVGTYVYYITCIDLDGNETESFEFDVTFTGKEEPSGIFKVVLTIFFIFLLAILTYLVMYTFGKLTKFEVDIINVAYNWGFLFALLGFYIVFNTYWADAAIAGFITLIITITGITNGFLPILFFFISVIFGTLKKRRMPDVFGRRR